MNSASDNRLSPEELKRRNQPRDVSGAQIGPIPMPEVHPTTEEWRELCRILWTMGEVLGEQTVILEELSQRLSSLRNAEQAQTTARETAAIRALLEKALKEREQAGKWNGRRFSLHWPSIPLAPFEPGWLFLPLGLALLLAVLCCVLRLWTNSPALM